MSFWAQFAQLRLLKSLDIIILEKFIKKLSSHVVKESIITRQCLFPLHVLLERSNKVNLYSRWLSHTLKFQENFSYLVGHTYSKQLFTCYMMSCYSFNNNAEICQCFLEALPSHIVEKHDRYYWISHFIWPRILIKLAEITLKDYLVLG